MLPAALGADLNNFKPTRKLVYKTLGALKLSLHVFEPENHQLTDKRPVIVFFFGGGWKNGKPAQFYPQCDYLAKRGIVAISAEYRVQSRNKTTPKACVKDGKSAIRFVKTHAAELGIDPTKVIAGGGSAGGHVAAATGNLPDDPIITDSKDDLSVSARPCALVLFNPVYDNGPGGYGHDRVKGYWQNISPMHNLSKQSPPTAVFLGTKDKLIPVATAEAYKRKMEELGVLSVLHLYEDQEHGFFNLHKNKTYYEKSVAHMDAFLVQLGYLVSKHHK